MIDFLYNFILRDIRSNEGDDVVAGKQATLTDVTVVLFMQGSKQVPEMVGITCRIIRMAFAPTCGIF
jgi:hypothetical protein